MTDRPAELARYAELTGDQALAGSAGHAAFLESGAREVVTECMFGQLPELETCAARDSGEPAPECMCAPRLADSDAVCECPPITRGCEECGAEPGEDCRPMCIGQAAHLDAIGVDLTAYDPGGTLPVGSYAQCSECKALLMKVSGGAWNARLAVPCPDTADGRHVPEDQFAGAAPQ